MKKHNFSAGPAILPQEVIDKTIESLRDFNGSGLSLATVSHRGKDFVEVMENARNLALELFGFGDEYCALFLQGGASSQFYMIPYNLLNPDQTASYLNTGAWANKAVKEAHLFGKVHIAGSSKEDNFNNIPKNCSPALGAAYYHITTNNTIYGTQIHNLPKVAVPLIADMSSDIFSSERDASSCDMIYAGAQKNLGPAGTTLVVIKKELLGKVSREIPTMINYQTHIDKDSMFNTPSVLPIYMCMLNMEWIKSQGGLAVIGKRNKAKSDLLYNEIDRNSLFGGTANREDRSQMNVTFVATKEGLDQAFLSSCEARGLSGLKGHRSVGGFRASLYNALELSSVQALVDCMQDFEKQHG